MRTGVRLGVDVGTVRIGIARTDREALLATPVETVPRVSKATEASTTADLHRILELIAEYQPIEVLVGLPRALSGRETASTEDARSFSARLAALSPVPVRLVDERLSSVSAQSALRESGRSSRQSKSIIDQAAAVIIVQQAVDAERGSGRPPGFVVEPPPTL